MPASVKHMQKNFRENPLTYVVQVVGVVVILLNLWLATKLLPLEQGIVVNAQQINGLEDRLNRIEGKLDRLIER